MIANALDSSDLFVRAGNSHNKTWALRPNNPLFQCDAAIAVTVEQLLSQSGPLSLEQLVSAINLPGADVTIIERVLAVHSNEFTQLPSGCIWFSNQPQPVASEFDNIEQALVFAFNFFPEGATVEELSWFLCLSKHNGLPITKMCISHELVRRSDLFVQIHRLKYAIAGSPACNRSISNSTSTSTSVSSFTNDEDVFNPDAFFCDNFQFSPE
ncbi:hypothetical protein GPJ56_004091 [Histomonas meleagridis]|uniref:uncharacterized protein n=1 Tax=Histomonas meleagridis TaxID=135588 RepID=UPI003559CFE0|nr:hypothetical protein GPJ56_004091 [Histomonas meleagridis]KAH0799488.1 hypothetical protein GO595_007743 [Histomonas meleagridis]